MASSADAVARRHSGSTEKTKWMRQEALYPHGLATLVERVAYRPGWTFRLTDMQRDTDAEGEFAGGGLTLDIVTCGYDAYHPDRGENYRVHHYMPVPAATYDERSWRRWLFDQILKVETHEAMEFFRFEYEDHLDRVLDVVRPYAPNHGPGNDPYIVAELSTELERRTRFTGEVLPQ